MNILSEGKKTYRQYITSVPTREYG